MTNNKKVFANVYSRVRGSVNGALKVVVEYVLVDGANRSGKATFETGPFKSESELTSDLKDKLATHLSNLYTPEVFKNGDIAGLGV